jgi:hypothetical protein
MRQHPAANSGSAHERTQYLYTPTQILHQETVSRFGRAQTRMGQRQNEQTIVRQLQPDFVDYRRKVSTEVHHACAENNVKYSFNLLNALR